MPSPPLQVWLDGKRNRGCTPETLRRYEKVVRRLFRVARPRRLPPDPRRWTARDGAAIRSVLNDQHWTVHIVADFARSRGSRVFDRVGLPRKPPVHRVRWLSSVHAQQVVRMTQDDPLMSMVALLGLGQGLRRVEWQRLCMEDVDLEGRRMLVRGKGRGRPKIVWMPLHPAFPPIFQRYAKYRERLLDEVRSRVPGSKEPPEALVHRTRRGLRPYSLAGLDLIVRRIQRRLQAQGETVRLSSHMFRRAAATLMERVLTDDPRTSKDGVYRTIQGFLRHENLATTMRYLEDDPLRQQRALDRLGSALPWGVAARGRPRAIERERNLAGSEGATEVSGQG